MRSTVFSRYVCGMVRRMDEKIDPDLFARLMRLSPRARKDILEYLGQGPVSSKGMLGGMLTADASQPPPAAGAKASAAE